MTASPTAVHSADRPAAADRSAAADWPAHAGSAGANRPAADCPGADCPAADRPGEEVAALRRRIDDLDADLQRLVQERSQVSARIGAARRATGGPRIVHARENEVVGRWRAALGRPGAAIALALLELGRGPA